LALNLEYRNFGFIYDYVFACSSYDDLLHVSYIVHVHAHALHHAALFTGIDTSVHVILPYAYSALQLDILNFR
jgi:hypothetical protein